MQNITIFVPLPEEAKYAYDHLVGMGGKCQKRYYPEGTHFPFELSLPDRVPLKVRLVVIGDMGNLLTATRVANSLIYDTPNTIFLIGIAGSLDREIACLGDVVVSSRVKTLYPDKVKRLNPKKETFIMAPVRGTEPSEASLTPPAAVVKVDDRKKHFADSFFRYRRDAVEIEESDNKIADYVAHLRQYSQPTLSPVLKSDIPKLEDGLENVSPKIVQADIFGSDMVIDSEDYIEFLRYRNDIETTDYYSQKAGSVAHKRRVWFPGDLAVVDMESYGFFKTLDLMKGTIRVRHAFAVRGISDLASKKEELDEDTFDMVRKVAVQNAIDTALDMIKVMKPLGR